MRSALRRLARNNALKARQRARQAMTMLRMFRKDPCANNFLRFEAERVLRSSIYHMRQMAIIEALLERDSLQPFLARIPRPRRPGELRPSEPHRDTGRRPDSPSSR